MNITDNLIRIKEGKDNIIKSLKNKGVSINDNTLINEIPTIIDNAEIGGGGGGDTPSQPDVPELVQKYEGATVFRIVVPEDNYEFAINLCNDATKATYDVDWGDGVLESGLTTDEQHHTYSKAGTYDVNIYNISKDITLGGSYEISNYGIGGSFLSTQQISYLFLNTSKSEWNEVYKPYYQTKLFTNIKLGNNINSLSTSIFTNCVNMESCELNDNIKAIPLYGFSNCQSLKSMRLPQSVVVIGFETGGAFSDCSSLTSINIPEGVTYLGSDCFRNTKIKNISLPSSLTFIGSSAFSDCSSLTSINIPDSVTSIDSSAFSGCSSLTSINIPDSVTSIGDKAFYNCSSLTSINIPDSVTSIDRSTFSDCSSLTSINIPDSVTSIGQYAFQNCSSLTSINIPDSVTSIGGYAFQNCSSLTSINIPEGVTKIDSNTFSGCSSLTSINIPDSVTSIGGYAFQNCSSLTSINIPEGVTKIDSNTFSGCSSLTSINIPDSVTSIGSSAFQNCSDCINIIITDNSKNNYLNSIVIPDSITSIGSSCFSGYTQKIEISKNVKQLGSSYFNYCYYLNTIICEALTPPTITSSTFPTSNLRYIKRYLYVPKDSVGYNEGNWKTYLIDKGWELRYIEDRVKTPTILKLKTKNNFFHNLQGIGGANLVDYELVDNEYIYHFDDKITELPIYCLSSRQLEAIELPNGLEIMNSKSLYNNEYLHTITCLNPIAPTIQNDTFSGIGTKVPSGTPKVLRVPEGAEGYDAWLSKLSGFTLEYFKL